MTQPPLTTIENWSNLPRAPTNVDTSVPLVNYKMFWQRGSLYGRWCCTWCGLSDENIKTITEHIESAHMPGALFRCQYCNAVYQDAQKLNKHYKIIHDTTMPLKCPDCPTICHNRGDLIVHMDWHRGDTSDTNPKEEVAICHKCGYL